MYISEEKPAESTETEEAEKKAADGESFENRYIVLICEMNARYSGTSSTMSFIIN